MAEGTRSALRRPLAVVSAVAAGVAAAVFAQIPTTSAQFQAQTTSDGNAFGSAADFCVAGSVTLGVAADTWANSSSPDRTYGTDIHLEVRADPRDDERIYLLPALPTVPATCDLDAATLTMEEHAYDATTLQAQVVQGAWDETTLTWNNQPSAGGPTTSSPSATGTWSIDVTPQIQAIVASGTNHGIRIRDVNEGTAAVLQNRFESSDHNGDVGPKVTYTWS